MVRTLNNQISKNSPEISKEKMKERKGMAIEIFSSAFCPLNCKYCYIPKTDPMKNLHKKVIKKLKNKTFIDDLEKVYKEDLEHLALWGAEPTITLGLIGKAMPDLMDRFSRLRNILFSTSLVTDPNIILNFIKVLAKTKRKLKFICQISLDGPAFIVDVNRFKGAAKKIPENFFYIIKELKKIDLKKIRIFFPFKSTLTIDNIRMFNRKTFRIKEYFDYFESISQRFKRENKNKQVELICSSSPTVAIPSEYKYTSKDGKELAVFFKKLRILRKENEKKDYWKHINSSLNAYVIRFNRLLRNQRELAIKPAMFTCSAGDSSFGLGINNDLHLCHRMFFLSDKEYIESIMSQQATKNLEVTSFKKGNIDLINSKHTADIRERKGRDRTMYVWRGYHDFTRLKISYIIALLKELALAGQCRKEYLRDDNLATLFALFINSASGCPAENLLNTGVIHFTSISLIRFFANGAFKEILEECKG